MYAQLIAVAMQVLAQDPGVGQELVEPDIIVEAPGFEATRRVVAALSAETSAFQLPRWNRRICVGVAGMRRDQGAYLIDRIGANAEEVGLRVGRPGCRANIWVIVTCHADNIAEDISKRRRLVTADAYRDTRGRGAMRDFVETPRPVRWWHVSQTSSNGSGMTSEDGAAAGVVGAVGGLGMDSMQVYEGSRLQATTRQDFVHALIVVDSRQMQGIQVRALADYVSMVALAQLNPETDLSGVGTILNLFETRAADAALTVWDRAYLEGLYRARGNAINEHWQERSIARRIDAATGAVTADPADPG